ncbi:uncharacterized protein LOC117100184 [Anneissia japonica]|uniref:uncharacterized protein LOC117100184 n=1 Tax=Anneissia japonica TaxID=1529436 RepID=UPI0014256BA6|nr:uncharacterized protein LOC117100184 [Anneissia japonica]
MDNWVDYDDGLLNGIKDQCGRLPVPDFGDNLETKPLLEDIDSYLNKNSALITSKEKAEESIGSCNLSNSIKEGVPKLEGGIPLENCSNQGHTSSMATYVVKDNVANSTVKHEPPHNSATNVFAPVMIAPGIMGFDATIRPMLKPVKRGRPRIHPVKPDNGIKRKPGRPRIHPVKPNDGIKRKPGRPRIHPLRPGETEHPARKAPVTPVIRYIRPKPDPSLMVFTGAIPHTFIPTTITNSIQLPSPQQRTPVRFLPPLAAIDPITGKRKRGRPRIHPIKFHDGIKRKPGRPRKVPLPESHAIKTVPPPVYQHDVNVIEKKFTPSSRSSELIEKVDVVEDKDRRFSIEAAVPESECKPFMCGACGDCFRTSDELMSHVVKHEEETDEMQGHNVEENGDGSRWPTDATNQRELIDNGRDSPSDSLPSEGPPKPLFSHGEHMRKSATLSRGTYAYSKDAQQHEQNAGTSRNEVSTCS